MADYPEHAKLKAIKEEANVIGPFLDWLHDTKKYTICRHESVAGSDVLIPIDEGLEPLMADYFKVDLKKIAKEKDAMVEEMRKIVQGGTK